MESIALKLNNGIVSFPLQKNEVTLMSRKNNRIPSINKSKFERKLKINSVRTMTYMLYPPGQIQYVSADCC